MRSKKSRRRRTRCRAKTGEYNANVSAAVAAGYGTQSMYGTALGYQARLSEQEIADIAGQYADEVDRLNAAIGAAINQSEQAALATERDRGPGTVGRGCGGR